MNHFQTVYQKFDAKISDSAEDLTNNEYKILLGNKIDSSLIIKFIVGLQKKLIDPNIILVSILNIINTDEHLLLLGLILRNGADPNLYLDDKHENLHILIYIFLIYAQTNIPIRNTIMLLLKLSGSDLNLSFCKGGNISIIQRIPAINDILGYSQDDLLNMVDSKLLSKLTSILDRPDLITNQVLQFNQTEIIRDHSINTFRNNINQIDTSNLIELTLKYYNLDAFTIALNLGIYPSYHQINIILLQIKMVDSKIIREILQNFFKEYISHNGKIDSYQNKLINYTLDKVNPSQTEKYINDVLLLGNDELKDPLVHIKKYEIALGKRFGTDARFKEPENDSIDLIQFNFDILAPNQIQGILDTKRWKSELDDVSYNKLYVQRSLLKRLGYTINNDKIVNSSYISTDFESMEKALLKIINLNFNKNIDLSILQMEQILQYININTNLFNLLSADHYKRTFYISCYEKLDTFPDLLDKINSC
jgi:hypothetical protein